MMNRITKRKSVRRNRSKIAAQLPVTTIRNEKNDAAIFLFCFHRHHYFLFVAEL